MTSGKKAVILLSRQPMQPCRLSDWITGSIDAVGWLGRSGYSIHTSVGMQTWELVLASAAIMSVPQIIYIPLAIESDFEVRCRQLEEQFQLNKKLCHFIPIDSSSDDWRRRRDQQIISEADLLVPVSLRPRSGLQTLMEKYRKSGKEVKSSFMRDYQSRTRPLSYEINTDTLNPSLDQIGEQYLIHWTRSASDGWRDEKRIDFYRAVIESDHFPRSALNTLSKIFSDQKIMASSRHMPGKTACVSFSSLSPVDTIPLMRWRARYREMSFEPYGIGIRKTRAIALGINPVTYYTATDKPDQSVDRWWTQSMGKKTDWSAEKEYRHRGDLLLSRIAPEDLIAITYHVDETRHLAEKTGIKAVSILR